jgi:hypothetical protein
MRSIPKRNVSVNAENPERLSCLKQNESGQEGSLGGVRSAYG